MGGIFIILDNMRNSINDIIYSFDPHKRFINRDLNCFKNDISKSEEWKRGLLIDVGGGRSPYKSIFLPLVNQYLRIDISSARYKDIDIIGCGEKIPVRSNTFNMVLLIEVLEHTFNYTEVIKESNRVLKQDGYLILTVPFIIGKHDSVDHYRYTDSTLEKLLADNGFHIIAIKKRGGIFSCLSSIIYQIPGYTLYKHKVVVTLLRIIISPIVLLLPLFDIFDKRLCYTLGFDILAKKVR